MGRLNKRKWVSRTPPAVRLFYRFCPICSQQLTDPDPENLSKCPKCGWGDSPDVGLLRNEREEEGEGVR